MVGSLALSRSPIGPASARRGSFRLPILLLLGSLLVQTAWILALPPFRGTDEFDHAYRAAQVARGDWAPRSVAAEHGRGNLVAVPRSLVNAARPVCAGYDYTGPDNCRPVAKAGDGNVLVASAAATYNPLYYWVIGTVASPFEGTTSLYAMRIASALLCALLIAFAGWLSTLWSRTPWPAVAMVVAMTPIVLFSVSVVAPNGLEMCAALSLWMALLGLTTQRGREQHAAKLIVAATASALLLATLRSLGPLWVALIVLAAAVLVGRETVKTVARGHSRLVTACVALVIFAASSSLAWTSTAGTQRLTPYDAGVSNPVMATLEQVPLWFLQGIAAFPRRSDPAPMIVYALVGVVAVAFLYAGALVARRRVRLTMLACLVVAVGGPVTFSILTIGLSGPLWQGRYGLPFHMGLFLLAGLALDHRRDHAPRTARLAFLAGWTVLAVAQVLSVVHVLDRELVTSPLAGSTAWIHGPAWVAGVLLLAGFALWGSAGFGSFDRDDPVRQRG